ncbi:MAG: hypothetical protein AAGK00_10760 [Pseudomonadota bacterium]
MSKLTLGQSKTARSGSWWGPVFGVFCLIAVQVGFVGIALWPAVLGDEFLRYEEVTVVGAYSSPAERWLIQLADGETIPMPTPSGIVFQQDATLCVRLEQGHYGNIKARPAELSDCQDR